MKINVAVIVAFQTFLIDIWLLILCTSVNSTSAQAPVPPSTTLPPFPPSRTYPFCVDDYQLKKYKSDLPAMVKFSEYVTTSVENQIRTRKPEISPCVSCGLGHIQSVNFYRIFVESNSLLNPNHDVAYQAFPKWDLRKSLYRSLQQWVHVHIVATEPLAGLLIQSMAGYQGLPHGQFNIEFACKDCEGFTDEDREKGLTDDVLALKENGKVQAAIIPCKRRTYLHARHPNVYIFAVENGGKKRKEFHVNFNYLDIGCRDMKILQFMILAIPEFGKGDTASIKNAVPDRYSERATYMYTAAIDHNFAETTDGVPFPYHTDFRERFKCHKEDDNLPPRTPPIPPINFALAINGDKAVVAMQPSYDQCLVDGVSDNIEDPKLWLSDLVCKQPERTRCDFKDVAQSSTIDNGCKSDPSKACLCSPCTDDDNDFTRLVYPRLIRRGYMARRFHGVTMIASTIAISIVSVHIARYFKETGGGCILVGCWFWVHLALSFLSNAGLFAGLLIGMVMPSLPRVTGPDKMRDDIQSLHRILGFVTVGCFLFNFWMGFFRPVVSRTISVWLHSMGGYLVILLGVASTLISVVCKEIKVYVLVMTAISIVPWIVGCVLQVGFDSSLKAKMKPSRKYFPVIEAIRIDKTMPMKVPRLVLVSALILMVSIMCTFSSLAGGYNGMGMFGQCNNCIWKYDDRIVLNRNNTYTDFTYFYVLYKCNKPPSFWTEASMFF